MMRMDNKVHQEYKIGLFFDYNFIIIYYLINFNLL